LVQVLGFKGIDGDVKLRLLPTKWPNNNLPPPTANLFAVSSAKGLIAAAGPDMLVLASTESVRKAYSANGVAEDGVKPLTPEISIPLPQRVAQVAFTAQGSYLVLAAEQGGGLAVYNTQDLIQGNRNPAFLIRTNGVAVRSLIPNPAPDFEHAVAVVLDQGQLMIANLQDKQLQKSQNNSEILTDRVSCVSWSTKGKALIAGLADGTAVQLMATGSIMATIPRPPQLQGTQFSESQAVSLICFNTHTL